MTCFFSSFNIFVRFIIFCVRQCTCLSFHFRFIKRVSAVDLHVFIYIYIYLYVNITCFLWWRYFFFVHYIFTILLRWRTPLHRIHSYNRIATPKYIRIQTQLIYVKCLVFPFHVYHSIRIRLIFDAVVVVVFDSASFLSWLVYTLYSMYYIRYAVECRVSYDSTVQH